MEQHFELVGAVKSEKLQMHRNIMWIHILFAGYKNLTSTSAALVPQFVCFFLWARVKLVHILVTFLYYNIESANMNPARVCD